MNNFQSRETDPFHKQRCNVTLPLLKESTMSSPLTPVSPACQHFQKVDILVWRSVDGRKQHATNCRYKTDVWEIRVKTSAKEKKWRSGRRERCEALDATLRNTDDILAEWWESRAAWTEGESKVEGQPQPCVKWGSAIWTAPSHLLFDFMKFTFIFCHLFPICSHRHSSFSLFFLLLFICLLPVCFVFISLFLSRSVLISCQLWKYLQPLWRESFLMFVFWALWHYVVANVFFL